MILRPLPYRPFHAIRRETGGSLGRYQTAQQMAQLTKFWLIKNPGEIVDLYHLDLFIGSGSTTSAGMPALDLSQEGTSFL